MNAMAVYANELKRVRALGIESAEIARATGAAQATVNAWLRATRRPTAEHRERLMELVAIVDRLSEVMDDDLIALWLQKPLPAIGDARPLDAIARGHYRDVSGVVAELENDSFA